MIRYIRQNKIFVFLLCCMLVINSALILQVVQAQDHSRFNDDNFYHRTPTAFELRGEFDGELREVQLTWSLPNTNKRAKSFEVFHNDEMIKDATNSYHAILPLNEYNLSTGNHVFTLVVTYTDGKILEKSVYVYIDEVFDIHVTSQLEDKKIVYLIDYWYSKEKPSRAPRLEYSDSRFVASYKETEMIEQAGNYVHSRTSYELLFDHVPDGIYNLQMNWNFADYDNISYPYATTVNVKGDSNEPTDTKTN